MVIDDNQPSRVSILIKFERGNRRYRAFHCLAGFACLIFWFTHHGPRWPISAEKRRFAPVASWTSNPRARTSSHTKNLEVDAEPSYTALTESTVKPAAADKASPVSLLYGSLPLATPLCTAISSSGSEWTRGSCGGARRSPFL